MRGAAKILLVTLAALGCGPKPAPAPAEAPPAAPSDPPPDNVTSMVTSMVVVDACPESKKLDPRRATREIQDLVGPCTKIPGGAAHFSATLQPGGRVELASPSGDPDAGVVPTCLLQKQRPLRHRLKLTRPCKFEVKLEQRGAPTPPAP